MDIFEQASKLKLRFNSSKGQITAEDLWDLPLKSVSNRPNLNDVAKSISKELKRDEEESFVDDVTEHDKISVLMLEIVKHIISVKKDEYSRKLKLKEIDDESYRISQLIIKRKEEKLNSKTEEDLVKMQAELAAKKKELL